MAAIEGMDELLKLIRELPGRTVKRIMDKWTIDQAREVAKIARRLAPRNRRKNRKGPETARLWKSVKASPVRRGLKKFPGSVSRAIAYGATVRGSAATRVAAALRAKSGKLNARRGAPKFGPTAPRARHFTLINTGTKPRYQKTTGRFTGVGPSIPFMGRAITAQMSKSQSDVGASLRVSYQKAIDAEIRRIAKRR